MDYAFDHEKSRQTAYTGSIDEKLQSSSKPRPKSKRSSRIGASQTELTKSSMASMKGLSASKKKRLRRRSKYRSIELLGSAKKFPRQAEIPVKPDSTKKISLPETYMSQYQFSENVLNNKSILTPD